MFRNYKSCISSAKKYLFVQKNGEPYDKPNTFNKWANRTLKKIFKKDNFSLTTLRHIYITRRDLKLEEKSGLERDKIAKVMGHSVGTQQNYLWHTYEKEQNKKLSLDKCFRVDVRFWPIWDIFSS